MEPDPAKPHRLLTRRRVLKTLAGAAFAGTGLLGWTLGFEPHWVDVVERSLPLSGLPHELVGVRLVQLSDFHAGRVNLEYLVGACEQVNALRPDLVVLTGDFIDHDSAQAIVDLPTILDALQHPRLGILGSLGNHDYSRGWQNVKVADRVAGQLADAGVRVLRNEAVDVAGLTIVGLDDLWSPRYHPWDVMASLDGERDALCLCHNPDAQDFADHWFKFRGWTLSGHTHGGQCKPPFLPPPLLPVENRRYVAGDYTITPTRRLYVNRGIGHTLRARINCRPEITVFTLTAS